MHMALKANGENHSLEIKNVEKYSSQGTLVSKNIVVLGKRTSIRLEPEMWIALKDISLKEKCSPNDICSLIFLRKHSDTSLTAAIRVFLMLYFRAAATEEGHIRAGHGNFEFMKSRARLNEGDLAKKRA